MSHAPPRDRGMLAPSMNMARNRIGSLVAVGATVLGGAAMVTATAVLGETGLTSHVPPERLAAADILIADPQRHPVPEDFDIALPERATVDADLVDRAAAVPGVAAAAGDLSFPAALVGLDHPADDAGHNWSIAALTSSDIDGRAPVGPGEIAIDDDLAAAAATSAGDHVTATVLGETAEYLVTAVVDAPGTGLYFDDAAAAAFAARPDGRVDLVAVTVEHGASVDAVAADLRTALADTGLDIVTGDARGNVETVAGGAARAELVLIAASLAGTILMLVGFITASAISVSVANQRRDLALLRAVGATPRQVRRLVAAQASAVAVIALAPGIALGYVAADGFAALLTDAGMLPESLPLRRTPIAAAVAAAALLITVQLAARGAAMRTSRLPATEAVAESRVEPREPGRIRTVIGLGLLAVAMVQALLPLFVGGEAAFIGAAAGTLQAVIGLALAGPALVRRGIALARRRLGRTSSVPMWLALVNGRAYAQRTAGAVTVLALAVGLSITQVFAQSTLATVAGEERDAGMLADAAVVGPAVGGVSASQAAELGAQPGIDAVPVIATSVVRPNGENAELFPMLAFGEGAAHVVDLDVVAGDLGDLTGDAVALSTQTARSWKAQVGDRVRLMLADGTEARPTVVAHYERGFGFGGVVAAADLITGHSGARLFDAVLVGGDTDAAAAWAAGQPGLAVDADPLLSGGDSGDAERWLNLVVSLAMIGYVLLGVGNSIVAATARRRGEFAALRATGAVPKQVIAMMRREALVLSAAAVAAGLAVSALPMSLLGLGLTGRPWPQGPLWTIPAAAAVAVVVAYAATMVPTRRALKEPPTALLAAVD